MQYFSPFLRCVVMMMLQPGVYSGGVTLRSTPVPVFPSSHITIEQNAESIRGHSENEAPIRSQHTSHLTQDRFDIRNVLEHRVTENSCERGVRIWEVASLRHIHVTIYAGPRSLTQLLWPWVTAHIHQNTAIIHAYPEKQPRDQPIATSQVEQRGHVSFPGRCAYLHRPPQRHRWSKPIRLKRFGKKVSLFCHSTRCIEDGYQMQDYATQSYS